MKSRHSYITYFLIRFLLVYFSIYSFAVQAGNPVSRFAYLANPFDYTLSKFLVDKDGVLHANGYTYVADKFPALITVHPNQKFLYVASRTVDSIRAYQISPEDGSLKEIEGSPFNSKLRSPFYGDFHPNGKFLFLAGRGGGVGAYRIDPVSGKVSNVPGQPFKSGERTRSLRVHPNGKFVYATNAYTNDISAYRINQSTGVLKEIKGSPFHAGEDGPFDDTIAKLPDIDTNKGGLPYNVSIHPDGNFLYVSNFVAGSLSVFRIHQKTGALTMLYKPISTGLNPFPTLVHPNGNFLYVGAWGDNNIWVYKIDKKSGNLSLTKGSPFEGYSLKPVDFSFNPRGDRLYTANVGEHEAVVYEVDPSSGNVSFKQKIRSREGALDIELVTAKKAVVIKPLYAFVLDAKGKKLINYSINPKSGDFTRVSSVDSGNAPADVAHDPKGRTVYISNSGDDNVTVFKIDNKTGKMHRNIGSPHPMGAGPTKIKIDTNGWYIYVLNEKAHTVSMHLMHRDSGELAEAIGSPMEVMADSNDIALDSITRFSYSINGTQNKISAYRTRYANAPARFEMKTYGSPFTMRGKIGEFVTDPYGRWAIVSNTDKNTLSVYSIIYSNGALFDVEGSPFKAGRQPSSIAVHPLLPYIYVANTQSKDIDLFSLDNLTGKLAKLSTVKVGDKPVQKLYVDPSGRFMFAQVAGNPALLRFKLDAISGVALQKENIKFDFVPTAISISRQID